MGKVICPSSPTIGKAFPIVGEEGHITLPIKDYPKMGRMMLDLLKDFPQLRFRFDCSFPPCLMDDIKEEEYPLVERFIYHGSQSVPEITEWKNKDVYFGCADDSYHQHNQSKHLCFSTQ